jgi:hypothetical protein
MKLIQLTQNKFAKVSDEDYEFLSLFKWHYNDGYAERKIRVDGKQHHVQMHREIMNAKKGEMVDHRDGDGLNNQRENLRLCTHSSNAMNMKKQPNKSSIYKGVTKRKSSYRTVIWKDNEKVFGVSCMNERWAGMIYDLNAPALFGEFARLNFAAETVATNVNEPYANQ